MTQDKEKKVTKYKNIYYRIFDGTFFVNGFIRRNFLLIIFVFILMLINVGNHYSVIMKIAEVDRLQKELVEVKYDAIRESSNLKKESRQSNVMKLIKEHNMDLEVSNQPPFEIDLE